MFKGDGLVFVGPSQCEVEVVELSPDDLGPGELIIENEWSVISAGTEVANFTGLDPGTVTPGSWNFYPWRPGYGSVGRVVCLGPSIATEGQYRLGDRVFAIGPHARFAKVAPDWRPVVRIGEEDDGQQMVLGRMASVSITALRKASRVCVGGSVLVIGLGLVGNFCAQLFRVAGMQTVGTDVSAYRVRMARETGTRAELVPKNASKDTVLRSLGLEERPDIVVEASGVPGTVPLAVSLARDDGEVILLGSPRGAFAGDATMMLSEVHHRGLHLIGALEWLLPLRSGPWQARWSLYDDYSVLFDMLRQGRLSTTGLITDVVAPKDAAHIYTELAHRGSEMGAVIFDWGQAGPA